MASAVFLTKGACIAIDITLETVRFAIAQIHDRIVALGLNGKLKDELCRKAKQLEGILQKIYTTAHDTNDKSILQAIEDVDQDLKKCSTACDRIEKKKKLNKFWSAVTDSNELKELDSLFVHSLQVLNTQLTASNYSTNADRQRDLRHLIRNPQDGFYPLDSTCIYSSVPEIVRNVSVKEDSPGVLRVSWTGIASARKYEVEYDQQNKEYHTFEARQYHVNRHKCLLDSTKISFPNKISYSIRIRGVNGKGPGEWSKCTVGKFTILPSRPRKPLAIHAKSSNCVTLVMEKPPEEKGVKPVTHYVVEYHRVGESEHGTQEFALDLEEKGKNVYKIDLKWNIDTTLMPTYHVKISLKNTDGVSKVYQDDIITGDIPPSEPVEPADSDPVVYTNTCTIIIKWNEPKTNAYVVHHYEVHWGKLRNITKIRKTKNCYAVFRELESWEKYLFKVRAVSRTGIKSEFLEINAETDSKAGKVAKLIGAGATGGAVTTVASPFTAVLAGVAVGAAAGVLAADSTEDKGKAAELAASTAAGIGGGVAGVALGLLITPFVIVTSPFLGTASGTRVLWNTYPVRCCCMKLCETQLIAEEDYKFARTHTFALLTMVIALCTIKHL